MKYKETNFEIFGFTIKCNALKEKADKLLEEITYFIFLPNGTKLI